MRSVHTHQYEVLRALWKMVAVPGLTYANAVLCLSTGMREFLERRQREVGRMALGTHRQTPVEAIQGELGWSSFTAREAVAKAAYENRLLCLPEGNLARQVLVYLGFSGRSTRWTRRTVKLRRVFDLPMVSLATAATAGSRKEVHERVQSAETRKWQEACQQKSSLAVYILHGENKNPQGVAVRQLQGERFPGGGKVWCAAHANVESALHS